MNPFFEELRWRGLIHQTTDERLGQWLAERPRTLYAGFDPTADSLHVGHLMGVLMLRRFQRAGHQPLVVLGGATGVIGDPSGKSQERNLLSLDELRANVEAIRRQMLGLLDFEGPRAAVLLNNYDWIAPFSYLDFLREVGKNFPVNVMLAKDSVKSRLERADSGLSYTEFSYMLLQAYDFVHLYDEHRCELQVGGSDQWGNITAGIDLARRMRGVQLYGLTFPLLTKADGSKMGKTESGAIWLSHQRTTPYQFYQYWINLDDDSAIRCLKMMSDLPPEDIRQLDESHRRQPERREAQKQLATELTRLVHGSAGLETAERATRIFFGEAIEDVSEEELSQIFADVPSRQMPAEELTSGKLDIVAGLVAAGLAKSKSEARRIVQQGGAYVNNRRVESADRPLGPADVVGRRTIVLRAGKKKYALLRFGES